MSTPKVIAKIEDLTLDPENANKGTERGESMVDHSLETYGAGRSILVDENGVVIAGNKILQAAVAKGFPIKVVRTDGRELVVVQREDLNLESDPEARKLAYADNRVAEVGLEWDLPQLLADVDGGLELEPLFLTGELEALGAIVPHHKGKEFDELAGNDVQFIECPKCGEQIPK